MANTKKSGSMKNLTPKRQTDNGTQKLTRQNKQMVARGVDTARRRNMNNVRFG